MLKIVTAKRNPLQLRPNNRKAVFIQRYASTGSYSQQITTTLGQA
jgi:hypothetical protein